MLWRWLCAHSIRCPQETSEGSPQAAAEIEQLRLKVRVPSYARSTLSVHLALQSEPERHAFFLATYQLQIKEQAREIAQLRRGSDVSHQRADIIGVWHNRARILAVSRLSSSLMDRPAVRGTQALLFFSPRLSNRACTQVVRARDGVVHVQAG